MCVRQLSRPLCKIHCLAINRQIPPRDTVYVDSFKGVLMEFSAETAILCGYFRFTTPPSFVFTTLIPYKTHCRGIREMASIDSARSRFGYGYWSATYCRTTERDRCVSWRKHLTTESHHSAVKTGTFFDPFVSRNAPLCSAICWRQHRANGHLGFIRMTTKANANAASQCHLRGRNV